LLAYFSVSLFVSATLLFLVQPMIGKMILPQLGGTPAVWNTCMVFFQAVLLVGYGYTHLLTTTQTTKRQVIIQGLLLFLPFIVLPFSLGDWTPPEDTNPIFSLLLKLTLMVGLPFFLVSTTAPLLQKWFFHTGHPAAKDPYFLYGASNFGSMLGLAIYPTVVEPWLPVTPDEEPTWQTQVHLWTAGYAIFVGLVVGCAVIVWQAITGEWAPAEEADVPATSAGPETPQGEPMPSAEAATAIAPAPKRRGRHVAPAEAPSTTPEQSIAKEPEKPVGALDDNLTLWRRLRWIGLAAAPSSLMLGVTTYMTTDIAAVAFFWIIPLALYLMTFILVFSRWPTVWTVTPHMVVMFVQPCLLLFLVLKMVANLAPPTWAEFALHLGAFFGTTLMCHGELAKDRPSTKHLTEFYFWMSFGGVLGGLFNALFAPIVFQLGIWEYPIAMAFACLLRSNLVEEIRTLIPFDSNSVETTTFGRVLDFGVPVLVGIAGYYAIYYGEVWGGRTTIYNRWHLLATIAGITAIAIAVYYAVYADRSTYFDKGLLQELVSDRSPQRLFLYAAVVVGYLFFFYLDKKFNVWFLMKRSYFLAVIVVFVLALSLRPIRFGLAVAALFIAMFAYDRIYDEFLYEGRGFFGLLRVRETPTRIDEEIESAWSNLPIWRETQKQPREWKVYRTLIHGGINHGRQIVRFKWGDNQGHETLETAEANLQKRREPITYFHERNGVAELFYKLCWDKSQPISNVANMNGASDARMPASMVGLATSGFGAYTMLANTQSEPPIAVLGLGTGILACYAKPFQHVDIFEIDPLVKNLSIAPGYVPPWHPDRAKMPASAHEPTFYFVHDAQERWAKIDVKLGDGRLKIKEAPQNYYHIIALDAFSSDAIPVHLLTKDAVKLYLDKLAEGGVLIFNTTNRYVSINGVLAAIARDLDLDCLQCSDYGFDAEFPRNTNHPDRFSADWVILQRKTLNTIVTSNDRSLSGYVTKEDANEVTLRTKGGDDVTLRKSNIKSRTYAYKNGGLPIGVRMESQRERLGWNGEKIKNSSGELLYETRWRAVEPLPGPVWTDGYSNMMHPRVMPWLWPWRE